MSSRYVTAISVFTGPLFFLLVSAVNRELFGMARFHWQAYLFFALSGVVHFVLGRSCANRAVQLIGSTRANPVNGLNFFVSILLAVIVLKETIAPFGLLGMLLAFSGPLALVIKEPAVVRNAASERIKLDRRKLYKGMVYALGTAVFWGSSPILIKLALQAGGTPIAGSLIAYVAGSIVISLPLLMSGEHRKEMLTADGNSLRLALLSGLMTDIAQALRYPALAYSSVITVSFMSQTQPLWVLLFAFVFNRKLESFSRWVLLGNALTIAGIMLFLLSQ